MERPRSHRVAGTATGSLLAGTNTLSLRAVFDMGTPYAYDIYYLDWVEITYDRLYAAQNGELYFSADAANTWRFAWTASRPWPAPST